MTKYIHYCWFGNNPLPKLAKKCIKSWKKYLPDYEIIEWNESNLDIHECKFVEQAYESKKWAFVADYARTKALYEMGGIYFDTDMEVLKNIDDLFKDDTFLGVEDSGKIAVGVWYEKESKSYISSKLLKFYQTCEGFDPESVFAYSIPKIITDLIGDKNFVLGKKEIQKLNHNITIYPREYFYPLSYDRQNNIFTENTCMIHYYDASWVPKYQQRENKIYRTLGREKGQKFIEFCRKTKQTLKSIIKVLLFPIVIKRNNDRKKAYYNENKKVLDEGLNSIKKNDIVTFYRKEWLGTSSATKEIFKNCIGIEALNNDELINYYAETLVNKKLNMIIFSAFDLSWAKLVEKIKELNPKQRIKVLWHGSNAMNIEDYDWSTLRTVLEYTKFGLIDSIGFVKKSMYEFYKTKGYNCEFVMNTVKIDASKYISQENDNSNQVKIGVYASGDRWVKNFYNQLSAASMIKNHLIDCVPKSEKTMNFASLINASLIGENKPIPRDDLLKRIAKNDINIYATFVECAPIIPLESFELGVPCITSNNHHYWEGTELQKYIIIDAPDNIIKIKEKIEFVLENKEKIMELYKKWKTDYDKKAKKSVDNFLK